MRIKKSVLMLTAENLLMLAAAKKLFQWNRTVQIIPVGMFHSRAEEELNKGIRPEDDALHPYSGRFYWEWWYFDASFDDGSRCVLELQTPNLVNMFADECAMLFNVYMPDKRTYNNIVAFPGSMWKASTKSCDVAIGENTIKGNFPEYRVCFKHENLACDLTFKNLLPGWTRGTGEVLFGLPEKKQVFGWVVAQPKASVTGTLTVDGEERQVSGTGYHDHNWGNGFLPAYVSHWVWGRLTTDRVTMIFADVCTSRKCGKYKIPVIFLAIDESIVLESANARFEVSDYRYDCQGFQMYPTRLEFKFSERGISGAFKMRFKEELEMVNTLAEKLPEYLVNILGRVLAAPAYYRFLADYEGTIKRGEEVLELGGETHWEYMVLRLKRGEIPEGWRNIPM